MDPPDIVTWSMRDYGNRVAAFRIMRLLDHYEIRATVALGSDICLHHPLLVEEGIKRDWEWMGHGRRNTRLTKLLAKDHERAEIHECLDTIERTVGRRPTGWLGLGLQETWDTLDLLVDEGIEYVSDWLNDDQPYIMSLEREREIVSVPYTNQLNDKAYEFANLTSTEFCGMIKRQFDVLYREGAESGRVMAIAYHPYLSGVPHRLHALDEALKYICGHDHVWRATGSEIVHHFRSC
jgi:peptidoglycan/xylan/chitin deacetylase (PgdA/CDA1 family)